MNRKALVSWSGGKDSCYAALLAKENGYDIQVLLNVLNEEGQVSRSHGIPAPLLQAQAAAAGLPVKLVAASWQAYEQNFKNALLELRSDYDVQHAVFGDIDLEEHRLWEEKVCSAAGLQATLPLWRQHRKTLVLQMLQAGVETVIVSCHHKLGESFLGRKLTPELINELESMGIDPCGEGGEFHTFVTYCPLFSQPVEVEIKGKKKNDNYWFSDLVLKKVP